MKTWHDDDYYCNDNNLVTWYDGYRKRKAQKQKIKEDLLPITWHPDRVMDWCMSEDEKKEMEKEKFWGVNYLIRKSRPLGTS